MRASYSRDRMLEFKDLVFADIDKYFDPSKTTIPAILKYKYIKNRNRTTSQGDEIKTGDEEEVETSKNQNWMRGSADKQKILKKRQRYPSQNSIEEDKINLAPSYNRNSYGSGQNNNSFGDWKMLSRQKTSSESERKRGGAPIISRGRGNRVNMSNYPTSVGSNHGFEASDQRQTFYPRKLHRGGMGFRGRGMTPFFATGKPYSDSSPPSDTHDHENNNEPTLKEVETNMEKLNVQESATNSSAELKVPPGFDFGFKSGKAIKQIWFYIDTKSHVQGPFEDKLMSDWLNAHYLPSTLLIRRDCDKAFIKLSSFERLCSGPVFETPPALELIPPLCSMEDVLKLDRALKEEVIFQNEDGSVTAPGLYNRTTGDGTVSSETPELDHLPKESPEKQPSDSTKKHVKIIEEPVVEIVPNAFEEEPEEDIKVESVAESPTSEPQVIVSTSNGKPSKKQKKKKKQEEIKPPETDSEPECVANTSSPEPTLSHSSNEMGQNYASNGKTESKKKKNKKKKSANDAKQKAWDAEMERRKKAQLEQLLQKEEEEKQLKQEELEQLKAEIESVKQEERKKLMDKKKMEAKLLKAQQDLANLQLPKSAGWAVGSSDGVHQASPSSISFHSEPKSKKEPSLMEIQALQAIEESKQEKLKQKKAQAAAAVSLAPQRQKAWGSVMAGGGSGSATGSFDANDYPSISSTDHSAKRSSHPDSNSNATKSTKQAQPTPNLSKKASSKNAVSQPKQQEDLINQVPSIWNITSNSGGGAVSKKGKKLAK